MESLLQFLAVPVLGMVGFYLLACAALPLLIRRRQWVPCRCELAPLPLDEFREARSAEFRRHEAQVLALGFAPVAASVLSIAAVTTYLVVYRKPGEQALLSLLAAQSAAGEECFCDITQCHEDGVNLSVTNLALPDAYPRWSRLHKVVFPGEWDLAALYRKFDRVRATLALPRPVAVPDGQELQVIGAFLDDQHAELVRRGLFEAEAAGGRRIATHLGIYRMTWKFLWPFKPWLQWRMRRIAAAWSSA